MVYRFLIKKSASLANKSDSGGTFKNENISNKEIAEELHKPIIKKSRKSEAHSSFIENIWGADLADMPLISKFNKGIRFLLYATDIFSKYAWVIPLKDKNVLQLPMLFKNF